MFRITVLLLLFFLPCTLFSQQTEKIEPQVAIEHLPDHPNGIEIASQNGNWGVYNNDTKQWLIPAEYENIQYTADKLPYFVVRSNGKYGVMDTKGKLVIGFDYQQLTFYIISSKSRSDLLSDGDYIFGVQKNGLFGIIDINNKLLLPIEYSKIKFDEGPDYPALKSGKWGIVSLQAQTKVPFQYDQIEKLGKNTYRINANNLNGVVLNDGQIILPVQYTTFSRYADDAKGFPQWYLITGTDAREGLWNLQTQSLDIPVQYEKIIHRHGDHVIVMTGKKYGVVNMQNKTITPFDYDLLKYITYQKNDQLLLAVLKGKYGLIDISNKKLIGFEYDDLQPIGSGLYKAGNKGKYKVIDSTGRAITKQEYDHIGVFVFGEATVVKDGQMGSINKSGQANNFTNPDGAGYTDIKKLLIDFASVMNSNDDSILTAFCKKVTPDNHTIAFFKRGFYKYGRFMRDLEKKEYTLDGAQRMLFLRIKKYRGLLTSKIPGWRLEYENGYLSSFLYSDNLCIESVLSALFKSGTIEIKFRFTDFSRIDGFWKMFYPPYLPDDAIKQ